MIEAPATERPRQDHVDVYFWMRELMLCYKFNEKAKYRRALDILKPYMDDNLIDFYEDIYERCIWSTKY